MSSETLSLNLIAPEGGIGSRVRAHRQARGWSMRELARHAGVSQPFVSKLESGKLLPSLPTLYGLAATFGLPVSSLLPPVMSREPDGDLAHDVLLPLSDQRDAAAVRIIAGGEGSILQAFEFTLAAGDGDRVPFQHHGEEFVHVVNGTVVSHRDGEPDRRIGRGESLQIDPTVPHRWTTAEEPATFILVCAEPHSGPAIAG